MTRYIVQRPGFLSDLLKFDSPSRKQILEKCTMLQASPDEGGKARSRLVGRSDNLHRLRTGDFRIFYTYNDERVSLWGVRRKTVKGEYRGKKGGDVTYDGIDEVEDDEVLLAIPDLVQQRAFDEWAGSAPEKTPLPERITGELLFALEVPPLFHPRLIPIDTQDDLLECPGVPVEHLLGIDRHMFDEPIELRRNEPELIAPGGIDDLLRYAQGELVGFLLRLNPEQQKYVTWAATANGPTLVKGGPGTGKSTVAIYRTREMIRVSRESGIEDPRILFTTYTKALVTFSQQLLGSLLVDDAICVDVRTADSLVGSVLSKCGANKKRPSASARETIRSTALENVDFGGNAIQAAAKAKTIDRLGRRYLFEEIETVIQARGLLAVDEYLGAARPGRRVPLNATQRQAVWAVAESYAAALDDADRQTWEQARATAAMLARAEEPGVPTYDAVVVDEAQDLDASMLRLLVEVCAESNRLFVTADVNQSIHSAGFSWTAIHDDLKFVGRTGILRANHRSTKEITEAARDYLASGIDSDLAPDEQTYVHEGPIPAVRSPSGADEEADLIARYLKGATKSQRLTIGSGAVLVPDQYVGRPLVEALGERDIRAEYKDSQNFSLSDNYVTVLPLTSAKGLEFPVVAVAGFSRSNWPHIENLDDDAQIEALVKARRTMFVAMTRAMRTLLVVTPAGNDSMLFDGFDSELWNTE